MVLAATLRIGEASRAAASAEAGSGLWDFSSCWWSAWLPGAITLAPTFRAVAQPMCSKARRGAVSPQEDRSAQLASFVLGDTQDTWTRILARENIRYPRAKLVLFRDYTQSGCGAAQSATGPFYCPADQKVYLDLGFWDQLKQYGASGEFAQAYVIAHEIGHHVQNVLGIERKVRAMQAGKPAGTQPAIRSDGVTGGLLCRGVGALHRGTEILEQGDVPAALQAAAAVGDDRMQKMARGYVTPDSFTHGSSQQRVGWFNRGLNSGQVSACNTFSAGQ